MFLITSEINYFSFITIMDTIVNTPRITFKYYYTLPLFLSGSLISSILVVNVSF